MVKMKKLEKSLIVTLPILAGLTIWTCSYSFSTAMRTKNSGSKVKEEALTKVAQITKTNKEIKEKTDETKKLEINEEEIETIIVDEGGSENVEPPIPEIPKSDEIKSNDDKTKIDESKSNYIEPKKEEPTTIKQNIVVEKVTEEPKKETEIIETPVIQEQPKVEQTTQVQQVVEEPKKEEVTQAPTPKVDTFYDSITGGVKEYATQQACLDAGEFVRTTESKQVRDYNFEHMDAQIHADFSYYRCIEVIDSEGSGWFLNIYCNSGDAKYCNNKFKPYLKDFKR